MLSKQSSKNQDDKEQLERKDSRSRPIFHFHENGNKSGRNNEKLWKLMSSYIPDDVDTIEEHIVKHVEYNLARTRFSFDNTACYQAIAYTVRDRLIEASNDTRKHLLSENVRRAYYFSMEYLPGRHLKNALVNLNLEEKYREALDSLGYELEELYEEEQDPGLGNGGLGRLASCYLDSATTLDYPVWGYGIRYNYGIFKQKIKNGGQCEVPDYWLMEGNPWEVRRNDVVLDVQFYGKVKREQVDGKEKISWEGDEKVHAIAYDTFIPGFGTFCANTLRLWESTPSKQFDFASFNHGDYFKALESKQKAEYITSVLYPNDSTSHGKELRLKQQYFFTSASLQDILFRHKVANRNDWDSLPEKVSIQLNDTHPSIGILELLRILHDIEGLDIDYAWKLVTGVFSYTNHTVLTEALEKWNEDLFGNLLPRHLELVHVINQKFLDTVREKYPNDTEKLNKMSVIEEGEQKKIRMANLSIIGSHAVNGVARVHSEILKNETFKDFNEMFPGRFQNKTNGIAHRRWIACANPELAKLYTEELGDKEWLRNLELTKKMLEKIDDPEFREKWNNIKQNNKKRVIDWIKKEWDITIKQDSMFDVMIKRIHEYKRQLMNVLYVVHRYLELKDMPADQRSKMVSRSVMIGGKAAPGYENAKRVIRLIVAVAKVVNHDPDTKDYLTLIFLPDYCVSKAELVIPSADISQHISTPGTEASGTSCMKFCLNGAMILGTVDGANVEIVEEIGDENAVLFGSKPEEINGIRAQIEEKGSENYQSPEVKRVLEKIASGLFGKDEEIEKLMETLSAKSDLYLVCYDFKAYVEAQKKVDELYKDREVWTKISIATALKSSKFSSDRAVKEYAEEIWKIKPFKTERPESANGPVCHVHCKPHKTERVKKEE